MIDFLVNTQVQLHNNAHGKNEIVMHETVIDFSSQHTSTITCTAAPRVWHFSAFHLAGCVEKEQVASIECVYPGMRLSTDFGKSIPPTAYQIFLFVSDSIKAEHIAEMVIASYKNKS